jgi:hypothetical protein
MPEKHCHSSSISLTGMVVANRVFAGGALLALSEGRQLCLGTFATFVPWAADCN